MLNKSLYAILTLCLLPLHAQADSIVIGNYIQSPVWLLRHDAKIVIEKDTTLHAGDQLNTGEMGKALLRLDKKNELALGSQSSITANENIITFNAGTLRLKQNALSSATQLKMGGAEVNPKMSDIWVSATPEKFHLLLLSGSIEVTHHSGVIVISEPLTAFELHADDTTHVIPPKPNDNIDLQALLALTNVTLKDNAVEPAKEKPVKKAAAKTKKKTTKPQGLYVVYVYSSNIKKEAAAVQNKLIQAGHPSKIFEAKRRKRRLYRVGVDNFQDIKSAKAFSRRIKKEMEFKDAWVSNTKR